MGMDVSYYMESLGIENYDTYKLSQKILVVAVQKYTEWVAYIGTIKTSSDEWPNIVVNGTKLNKKIAEAIFPDFAKKYKWRA
ncbi:MAG: hypothetical protein ACYTAN_17085 [Planctomycetota bacterium]|jgi:hypothetical protein